MIFLSPEHVDRLTLRAPRYFLFSLGLLFGSLAVSKALGLPHVGWVAPFSLFYLSIVGAVLRRWRLEYGLWMMAGLWLLVASMMYCMLVSWEIGHFMAARQAQPNLRPAVVAAQWLFQAADVSIGVQVFWRQVQLCLTVIHRNWSITKSDWEGYKAAHRIGMQYQPPHVIEKYRLRRRALLNTSLAAIGMLLIYCGGLAAPKRAPTVYIGGLWLGLSVLNTLRPAIGRAIVPSDDSSTNKS